MMRSASREALESLRQAQETAVGASAPAAAYLDLAAELYSVADLLVAQPQLRRALGDPSRSADVRAQLIGGLLEGQVSAAAISVTQAAVRQRWSSPWDLADSFELSGNDALFAAAEREGHLDDVEDELFRFERILDGEGQLSTLLDESTVDAARRVQLLDAVVGAKVNVVTRMLLEHAVSSSRKRSVSLAIDDLLEEAAARQARSVARVISAVELTGEQQARLVAALTDIYQRPISLRTAVDPTVRGGAVIRVGDEIIDGSVAARLVSARAALAG
jgi:F-type H+-transporting ATPase subunit delta